MIVEPQVQNSPKPQPYTTSFDAKFIVVDPDPWAVASYLFILETSKTSWKQTADI